MRLPISVLVPIYGAPIHWEECLESIRTQNISEIVLVLNGVDDIYEKAIKNYCSNSSLFVLLEMEDANLVKALNYGLQQSSYEFVGRLDIDDVALPGRFEDQYLHMQQDSSLVACGSQVIRFSETGESSSNYPITKIEVRGFMMTGCGVAHPSTMYLKSSVIEVGGYREEFKHAEDYDLWLRLLEVGDIDNIDKPLIKYRQHELQISNKYRAAQDIATRAALYSMNMRTRNQSDIPKAGQSLEEWLPKTKVPMKVKYGLAAALQSGNLRLFRIVLSVFFTPFLTTSMVIRKIKRIFLARTR